MFLVIILIGSIVAGYLSIKYPEGLDVVLFQRKKSSSNKVKSISSLVSDCISAKRYFCGIPILLLAVCTFISFDWWMFFGYVIAFVGCMVCNFQIAVNYLKQGMIIVYPEKRNVDFQAFYKKLRMHSVISACIVFLEIILAAYPFLFSSNQFYYFVNSAEPGFYMPLYEGGIIVYLLVVILEMLLIEELIGLFKIISGKSIKATYAKLEADRIEQEKEQKRLQQARAEKYKKFNELTMSMGTIIKSIRINGEYIKVSEETQQILLIDRLFKFSDIISCRMSDLGQKKTYTTTRSEAATGDMIARAVAGGIVAGKPGAIIGGTTGARTITNQYTQTNIIHDYTFYIAVNDMADSVVILNVGNDERKAMEIAAIFDIIIKRNKS